MPFPSVFKAGIGRFKGAVRRACDKAIYKKGAQSGRTPEKNCFEPLQSILLTQDPERARTDANRVMRENGLKLLRKDGEWTVMEKGLPPRLLALLFIAGLIAFVSGPLITSIFAFEGSVTLKADSPVAFVPEGRGIMQSFWKGSVKSGDLSLFFEGSTAEYIQAAAPGVEDALVPLDMRAKLKVLRDGSVTVGVAGARKPMRYRGYAFRLLSLEQTLRLRIDGSPILLNAKPGGEALIPGSLSTLSFGEFRSGAIASPDGSWQELKPHVTVRKKGTSGEPAMLRLGEPVIVDGTVVALADTRETAVLAYRYDPGRAVLIAGGLLTVLAILFKLYWPYYSLAYRIDDSGDIVRLDLFASSGGMFASAETLLERIERLVTEDDLRPEPISD